MTVRVATVDARELGAFLNAIRRDEPSPVSGSTALTIMDLVWSIRKTIGNKVVI